MVDNRKGRKKSTLEKQDMARLYEEEYSTSEIAKLANVTPRYVRMVLNELNVKMRPRGHWKRKYFFNEDYFKTWSNNMAYILGFFVADGTIARNAQFVSIAQKESNILEDIKKEIGTNQPLYQNKHTGVYILHINSKIFKNDLMNIHGIMPNKSNIITFPYVPEQYLSHFIRGYFDGDGYVSYNRFFVSFVGGSYQFMIDLKNKIEQQGFETNFTSHETYFRVYVSGRKTIYLFSEWLYQNKELYLKRKFAEFDKETEDVSNLKDNTKRHKNALLMRKKV